MRVDAELRKPVPAVLAVHDDTIEARQEAPPEVDLRRSPAWEHVVRGEDRRRAQAKQPLVELR